MELPDGFPAFAHSSGLVISIGHRLTVFGSAAANPSNWLEVSLEIPMDPHVLNEIIDLLDREPRIEPLDGFCLS